MKVNVKSSTNAHFGLCWFCSWHPKGDFLVTCGQDKKVLIFSYQNQILTMYKILSENQFTRTVRMVHFSNDGSLLSACGFDSQCITWKDFSPFATASSSSTECKGGTWSPSNQFLATCERGKNVWIWDVYEDDVEFNVVLNHHKEDVKCVIWHPLEDFLYSCGFDGKICSYFYEDDDWETLCVIKNAHESTIWSMVFDKSGEFLFSGGHDGFVKLWKSCPKFDNWNLLNSIKVDAIVYCMSINMHDSLLSLGLGHAGMCVVKLLKLLKTITFAENDDKDESFNQSEKIYEFTLDAQIIISRNDDENMSAVNCVAFNPTENVISCCCDDGNVVLVEVSENV